MLPPLVSITTLLKEHNMFGSANTSLTALRLSGMSCNAKIENLWSLITFNGSGTQMKLNQVNLHTQKLHISFGKGMT